MLLYDKCAYTNFMEHNLSLETDSHSASPEILCPVRKPRLATEPYCEPDDFNHHTIWSLKIHFNIILYLRRAFRMQSFLKASLPKLRTHFLFPKRSTCTVISLSLASFITRRFFEQYKLWSSTLCTRTVCCLARLARELVHIEMNPLCASPLHGRHVFCVFSTKVLREQIDAHAWRHHTA
jgi:hypothetical protein